MVKVICHKAHRRRTRMVQCYSTGDSNVNFHIGATWRIRLNLCILRPTLVHNRNGKWTGLAVFAQLTAESAYTLQHGRPYPPELPRPMEDLDLPCNTWCFGPIPLPSNRHHLSNGDCLEGKGKIIRSVLCNIVCNNCAQCVAHTYEQT